MKSSAIYQNAYNVSMCDIQVYTIINDILQSCTYIISKTGEDGVFLVDCGAPEPIISYLENNDKHIKGVFLTHAHYDHIYGLIEIMKKYPNLDIFASEKTFLGLEDSDLNMSYLYTDDDFIVRISKKHSNILNDKTKTIILNEVVECIATPGHDVDCMSYVIGNSLFTGDSYNPNSPVFTKWRNSDVDLALRNETMLAKLAEVNGLNVYPGHNIES